MTDLSSPPAARLRGPRWLDGRLALGVLLLLLSVVTGATVVGRADSTTPVYALRRALAAGVTLTVDDVHVVRARLLDDTAGRYVSGTGASPVGRVLARPVGLGELLPYAALVEAGRVPPARRVMVAVDGLHVPRGLTAGDRVDVFVSYGAEGRPTVTRAVLRRVLVVGVSRDGGALAGGSGVQAGVEVEVAPAQAGPLVLAVRSGRVDLVRVVTGAQPGDVGDAPLSVDPNRVVGTAPAPAGGASPAPGAAG